MRIQNLKAPPAADAPSNGPTREDAMPSRMAGDQDGASGARATGSGQPAEVEFQGHQLLASSSPSPDRQAVEIALLKARIQHLEVVVETARGLMGSNQERLLRRLHEAPREIVGLMTQLRRIDPNAAW